MGLDGGAGGGDMRSPMPRAKAAWSWISRRRRLAAAMAWRQIWANEGRVRTLLWGQRYGFDFRGQDCEAPAFVTPEGPRLEIGSWAPARTSDLGVIAPVHGDGSRAVLAEAGRFYGLDVHEAAPGCALPLVEQALQGRWPLLGLSLESFSEVPQRLPRLVLAYVESGGTLLLNGVGPRAGRGLRQVASELGVPVPEGRQSGETTREVLFAERHLAFAQELTGVGIEVSGSQPVLNEAHGGEVLAWVRAAAGLLPAVVELRVGAGRVVISASDPKVDRLARAVSAREPLSALPAMMLVRQVYGETAWRVPGIFANFIIDDPALRDGRLGLDYRRVLAQAREHDFHVTIATIPRELGLAEPQVVAMLRDHTRWLSACYHGSDHRGYEFYLPEAKRMRYGGRPLAAQKRALLRAAENARRFSERSGVALDRVMVFPHGIGSPQVFGTLQSLGFTSSCNSDDRYPLGAPVPSDFDLGLRPSDLAWEGFPLMWRRGLPDRAFILDLFLGRPLITFGHTKALGPDIQRFADRADELHRIAGEELRWSGLEDIALHSYLQRRDPASGWRVLMLSNEICLHNPDPRPRTYSVERQHLPFGSALVSDAGPTGASEQVTVTVPPGGTRKVRVAGPGARLVGGDHECSFAVSFAVESPRAARSSA